MKKKLFYFATLLVVAICSMTLASCGDDDDDDGGKYGGDKALVGTWVIHVQEYGDDYYEGYKFTSDGYISYFEWTKDESPNWNYNKSHFKAKDGVITVYKPDGSVYESRNYSISSDGKTLWIGWKDGHGEGETYTKQ